MKISDIKVGHVYRNRHRTKKVIDILDNGLKGSTVLTGCPVVKYEFHNSMTLAGLIYYIKLEEFARWAVEDLGEVEQ
jgi:hypothetical protein